jgi:hypothetical protein
MTTLDEIRARASAYSMQAQADLAFLLAAIECKDAHIEVWRERAERERDAALEALRRLLKIIGEGGSWRDGVSPLTSVWEITAEEDRELDAALDQAGDALTPSERESTP